MADIPLDGTEITIIKALGIGASAMSGKDLKTKCGNMQLAEMMSTLQGLMSVGFVEADKDDFDSETFDKIKFMVNSGYAKELKEALDPAPAKSNKSERVRRE